MGVALLLGSLALLALPGVSRRWGRRARPADWSHVCGTTLVLGALMFELGAVLYAIPTIARSLGFTELATMCRQVLEPFTAGPRVGFAAAVLAVTVPSLAALGVARARRSARRAYVEPWLGDHEIRRGYELVTLDSTVPVAVAVPGPLPQVVVTRAIVDRLSPHELAAVVRHEMAHLQHGHDGDLAVASALDRAFFFLPFVRKSTGAWRAAIERWADETAAGASRERRRALREALLGVAWMLADPALAAFSNADCLLERLDALETPSRPLSRLARNCLHLPALLAIVIVALALTRCVGGDVLPAAAGSIF